LSHNLLIVVDMQNDFISGPLGTPQAEAIVPRVCDKIRDWDGDVFYTKDTHFDDYLETLEGEHIPVEHCVVRSPGWQLDHRVMEALPESADGFLKGTFGSVNLANYICDQEHYDRIEIIGLCTDICVVSNALLLRAHYPDVPIAVDASCCAGTTEDNHKAALQIMKQCCIDVINAD